MMVLWRTERTKLILMYNSVLMISMRRKARGNCHIILDKPMS
jgi:hypothetical protein